MAKFGLNLLLWTTAIDESLRPLAEQIKSWGYDGVELPIFESDEKSLQAAARWLDELGLDRTTVTVCSEAENLISPEFSVRQAGIERLKRVVDASAAAGSRLLCGPLHSALGRFSGCGPTRDEWKWALESLAVVADYGQQAEVTLAVEYLNRFECYFLNCAAECAQFVEELNHPNLKMMYDTFHAHIEEKDVHAAIQACRGRLAHVHISENDRSTPGRGSVDWHTTFSALHEIGYDGWLTIEAFGLVLPELAAATKIWRRMYESEEQLAIEGLQFLKRSWQEAPLT